MSGTIAGRYELVEVLGRGGMGAVWRALDRTLDREVAIKEVTLPQGLDDEQVARLHARTLREARSAARLDHPRIVTVHDVIEEDGRPWIVMQLVRAEGLDKAIAREGRLPPERVASIGLDLLDALGAAHAAGVVHRDVKPGNVLLPDGRAVLTDFGIATVAGDETLTQTGAIVGSPAYLAPEQARYQKATPASDLWSLGGTLYAAVEGRPPFQRPDVWGVMAAVLSEDPDPLQHAGPLAPVLHGLLRKEPERRLGPDEVERLLRQVAQGRAAPHPQAGPRTAPSTVPSAPPHNVTLQPPPTSTTVGPPTDPPRSQRRVPWPLVVTAGIFAAALVAAVVSFAVFVKGGNGHEARVPEGYELYRGSAFEAAVPKGWEAEPSGDNVTFTDPARGVQRGIAVERVASAGAGDPGDGLAEAVGKMQNTSQFPGFKQERFTRDIPYQGGKAAEVQFTFTKDGAPARARVRAFVFGGGFYQVILIAAQKDWQAGVTHFETLLRTWRAPSS